MYRIDFGKYAGQTLERLFFEQPDYIRFAMTTDRVSGGLRNLLIESAKLIALFDVKPLVCDCDILGCDQPADVACFDAEHGVLSPLCPSCIRKPHRGSLQPVTSCEAIIRHASTTSKRRTEAAVRLLGQLAAAKGLTETPDDEQLEAFFRRTPSVNEHAAMCPAL